MSVGTTTRALARDLWIGGTKTDAEIAKSVGTTLRNIVRWRERERWQDLKMLIEARAATMGRDQATTAEERHLKLMDILDGFVVKILNKGQGLGPKEVRMLVATIAESQEIRHLVEIRRKSREYLRKEAEKRAAEEEEKNRTTSEWLRKLSENRR
jgi:hypothetical protein